MPRLLPHPDFPGPPQTSVEAEAGLSAGVLTLRYRLTGPLGEVRLPEPAACERRDELWRHTCFEAFVRAEDGGYLELNLAPSTAWAAYRFDGYRTGMRPAEVARPAIIVDRNGDRLELTAEIKLAMTPPLRIGLSAVVEAGQGLSYWALRHPPGRPDFHHPDCFALELPATEGA